MMSAYPLQWPIGRPRTSEHSREASRFDMTPDRAREELLWECERMGGRNIVISTNIELRRDGQPYARQPPFIDPAVAVYFDRKGKTVCFSCDRYQHVWENMRAIGKTIEAMRGIERWGAHEVLDQMFRGFTALPPPGAGQRHWWAVLDVAPNASAEAIRSAWRAKVRETPEGERAALNVARDEGLAALN